MAWSVDMTPGTAAAILWPQGVQPEDGKSRALRPSSTEVSTLLVTLCHPQVRRHSGAGSPPGRSWTGLNSQGSESSHMVCKHGTFVSPWCAAVPSHPQGRGLSQRVRASPSSQHRSPPPVLCHPRGLTLRRLTAAFVRHTPVPAQEKSG